MTISLLVTSMVIVCLTLYIFEYISFFFYLKPKLDKRDEMYIDLTLLAF